MAITDMQKALNLVTCPASGSAPTGFTVKSLASGNWSAGATWSSGAPPVAGDKVWIQPAHTVTFDVVTPRLVWLFVQGVFQVSPAATTTLNVETIVTDMNSTFQVGTQAAPITGSFLCTFLDSGPIDTAVYDPYMMSRQLLAMGQTSRFGVPTDCRAFTTGNKKGDTVVTLTAPMVGLAAGDPIFMSGVSKAVITSVAAADDDLCTVQSVNGVTVTLTAPLQFDHPLACADGSQNKIYILNRKQRTVEFTSENTTISRRGCLMFMNGNMNTGDSFASRHMGRTDKSIPVTDPDGLGGGVGNVRGRYTDHYHKNGGTPGGMMTKITRMYIEDDPGWPCVNHSSYVDIDSSAAYLFHGSGFTGEAGDEMGCFCDCTAARSTNFAGLAGANLTGDISDDNGKSDFGRFGHGFWTQGGAIQLLGTCIATGCPLNPFVIMGKAFTAPGATSPTTFPTTNLAALQPPPTVPTGTPANIQPNQVPQLHSGMEWFGCSSPQGMILWTINGNPDLTPTIAKSVIQNFHGDGPGLGHALTYSSWVDYVNGHCVGDQTKGKFYGFGHSGLAGQVNHVNCTYNGFDVCLLAPTSLADNITGCTLTGRVGIHVQGAAKLWRHLTIDPACVFSCTSDIELAMDAFGTELKYYFMQSGHQHVSYWVGDDVTTFGTLYLYYPEQGPNYPLSTLNTLHAGDVPTLLSSLTGAQEWSQYGLQIGGRFPPSDAVARPTGTCLQSTNLSTLLPNLYTVDATNPWGVEPQYTNAPANYNVLVKDNQSNWQYYGPFQLTDKSWNVCLISIDGYTRGVKVYCDSTQTYAKNWATPPSPLPPLQPPAGSAVVAVSISPTTATVVQNTTQQFTATVTGSSNTAVTWTCTHGTITSAGLYTAPASGTSDTVTATSQADTTKSASATVTITAPPSGTITLAKLTTGGTQGTITVTAGVVTAFTNPT